MEEIYELDESTLRSFKYSEVIGTCTFIDMDYMDSATEWSLKENELKD